MRRSISYLLGVSLAWFGNSPTYVFSAEGLEMIPSERKHLERTVQEVAPRFRRLPPRLLVAEPRISYTTVFFRVERILGCQQHRFEGRDLGYVI